jgi:SAM-dependent methyltransferase/tetratricopeptide (TPR) repeat protein
MNRKERRAAQKRGQEPGAQAAQIAQMFAQATRHRQSNELAEAEALCRGILAEQPRHAGSLYILGTIAMQVGRPDVAAEWFGKAIAADHRVAAFHNDLGLAQQALGKLDEAAASFRRVIKLEPENGRGYNNLAIVLERQGRLPDAAVQFVKTLDHAPELFDDYTAVVETLFRLNPGIAAAVTRVREAWPRRLSLTDMFGADGYAALCGDALLRYLLIWSTVRNVPLERMLTSLRKALLESAADENVADADDDDLKFRIALAQQCFVNEYVFATTPEELAIVTQLKDTIAAMLAAKSGMPAHTLAAVASYIPLDAIAYADVLLDRNISKKFPVPLDALLIQQLREPHEERRLRESIPALTPIDDETSLRVRRQYEENPYPRWIPAPPRYPLMTINDYLHGLFPAVPFRAFEKTGALDVLIAGCGTGRHPISVAQTLRNVRILAVDLSLASLAYAQRKSRELRAENISYAQADILKLGALGRTFDVVDAGGVLHHMQDPVAGWRVLASLVRPGGFLRLGLYSEIARRDVVAARAYCVERNYHATTEDIRVARQELADANSEVKSVARYNDFFSTSECRDLLFHVQETRFTIPQIRTVIDELGFSFIGFDLPPENMTAYARRFPDDPSWRNLRHWEEFERAEPNTFSAMYQFWMQRA